MTLEALLQLLRGSILNDRTDRVAGSSDYLWEDSTLVEFINEAQRLFAVRGLVLRDGTTDECTKVTLVTGQTTYPLHESVIAVISAKPEAQDADLTRIGHAVLAAYQPPTDAWTDPAGYTALQPGATLAYSTDEGLVAHDVDSLEQMNLRVYPAPAAAQNGTALRLRVIRRPLAELTVTSLSATPEIPRDHHIEMLDYAAYLALRIVDDDAGAPRLAENFKNTFFGNVDEARKTTMRKLFAPTQWGFGSGGWSWSR